MCKVLAQALLITFGWIGGVQAAPIATLSFETPRGTVGATDSIDVFVTLTLDATSAAITTDASGTVTSGYGATDLPPGFSVTSSNLNTSFMCSGTFTNACNGPPYDFHFGKSFGGIGTEFGFASSLDIQPGNSQTFLFGTFAPTNGTPVAPGTYSFYDAAFFIQLYDNTQNDPGTGASPWHIDVNIASTCSSQDVSCSFQRTVAAVPEPETYAMLLAGLGLVGFVVQRRALRL